MTNDERRTTNDEGDAAGTRVAASSWNERHRSIKENTMSTMPRSPDEPLEPDPDKLLDPDAPPNPDDPDMPDGPDSATPMVPADPKNGEPRM
ncbi:hypothetical protein BRPE64_BCDS05490 [Caballeronia insecticola]|uniref:Uncharacterized protein n=2 Tax=Caballeronia insecticola TaxID=758793 RepID=R4WVY4_9BURK|nr:hypothetical protein BRPE64_BCDS05490 [Caballeronia insecticola]